MPAENREKTSGSSQEKLTFDDAVSQFRAFLQKNACPARIAWVRPEDVLITGTSSLFVRTPLPTANELKAREMFGSVMDLDRGLRMAALGQRDGVTYCYLWGCPEDHQKSPGLWPHRNFAMSAPAGNDPRKVHVISGHLRWHGLRWRYRRNREMKALLFS